MKKLLLTSALAAGLSLSACATDPYGYNDPYYGNRNSQGGRVATGAVGGAVLGGVAGAIIPGVSTVEGAIAGAVLGGVAGAVIRGRQHYRDTRGYCYYVDQNGNGQYVRNRDGSYSTNC